MAKSSKSGCDRSSNLGSWLHPKGGKPPQKTGAQIQPAKMSRVKPIRKGR